MKQLPKKPSLNSATVEAKAKSKVPLVKMTRKQIEDLISPAAINQQLDLMRRKGLLEDPSYKYEPESGSQKIAASIVDAVRWQDSRVADLRNRNVLDIADEKPWIDDLLEDFVVYDLSPSMTSDEAKLVLKGLLEEVNTKWDSYGPEARNYFFNLKRELELLIEKSDSLT